MVLDAAEFDERADVIPIFLIGLAVGLAHTGQFVGNLLCDIVRNLPDKTVVLQRTSRYIQRKIRAVDHAL